VLNLFAYTGGSTLAAAAAGAEVVHIDAAQNVVNWARRNSELSGLSAAPIRWIAEDALTFVRREIKRGHRYDAVILDPPTYGHGPKGEVWQIERSLELLLDGFSELAGDRPAFALLTCHSPDYSPARLSSLLAARFSSGHLRITAGEMKTATVAGRTLPSGACARLTR
jgi:23S rRNA (cytosine1962-C5)-methyltransferase